MAKVHPSQKSQKNRKSRVRCSNPYLPIELRQKGIATQRELVMALLPYMEWVKYQHLRTLFWKYITHRTDGPLRCLLHNMKLEGLIEKTYDGQPAAAQYTGKNPMSKYLYVRRVAKDCGRVNGVEAKLSGTLSTHPKAIKTREYTAKKKRGIKPPVPKKTMKNLTLDDCAFIRDNPHGMTQRERAEMFNIDAKKVLLISQGHIPSHLKRRLFDS